MASQTLAEIFQDIFEDKQLCLACWDPDGSDGRGDSVLEKKFWDVIRRTEGGWHGSIDQFQIGRYRVDGFFDCDGAPVIVECDGRAYHDRAADHLRDKDLLQCVRAIIRIPFAPAYRYPDALVKVLGTWFPRFVNPRCGFNAITVQEMKDIRGGIRNTEYEYDCEYESFGEWLDENNDDYEIWSVDGNVAFVGSPRQFYTGNIKHAITIQYGNGEQALIDRLYKQIDCKRDGHSITSERRRAA